MMAAAAMAACLGAMAAGQGAAPARWMREWANPPAKYRPLQIIHGISPAGGGVAGMAQIVPAAAADHAEKGMKYYQDLGLGGVVCNVMFENYMQSEPAWNALVAGVRACRTLGMVVWIYDEAGYPSGAAGGLVLKENPEYEAQELAYDASRADPFLLRPAYEFTHASNNYYAARRYVNLIDDRATRSFVQKTHQAYRDRIGGDLASSVSAFFTDEPSLITVNLGQIPESARRTVPTQDPLDPAAKSLPAVPWGYDLAERYRERYGEDLLAVRRSLFAGDAEADRAVRRRYWGLIADLVADRYFSVIRTWCAGARVASSGHILWEEALMHHPTLYGNALKALSRMDIPGLDELATAPDVVINGHWMTAALPASAAILNGGRKVFTEISDFSEKMGGAGPAPVAEMQAAAAWQAAFGVTEFTLYYSPADRSAEDYRAYCATVGRLNAILREARLDPDVLLYYPVADLWAEYRPVAEPLGMGSQSSQARRIIDSFNGLGAGLTRGQIPFCLIDHDFLAGASVRSDGRIVIKGHAFRALVVPAGVTLPERAARTVARFAARGGLVVRDGAPARLNSAGLRAALSPTLRLTVPSESIVVGRFVRDGRPVVLAVNVGREAYTGALQIGRGGEWMRLDPATGASAALQAAEGAVPLTLGPRQSAILVGAK